MAIRLMDSAITVAAATCGKSTVSQCANKGVAEWPMGQAGAGAA